MNQPVVSVVMAAYNGADLIGETLDSLWAQSFADFEVIVVDDCSTDDTLDVLRACPDPRLRIIAAKHNAGPVRSRNRAFAKARGRYVAGLDQDDICLPERFARQVAYLDAHLDIVLLGTAAAILEDGTVTSSIKSPVTTPRLVEWLLHIENPLVWSTVMVRRNAVPAGDFTRPDFLYAEDFDLYNRMARIGGIARLDDPSLLYRKHERGASKRYVDTMQASATRVLEESYAAAGAQNPYADARLIVDHLMRGTPVPDRMTLERLGELIGELQADFLASRAVDEESLAMIRWETALRWGKVVRTALKAGTIGLAAAMAVRPDHLGMGYSSVDELLTATMVGGARNAIRRNRAA
ncbi:glycosyltransferase family 2 protein [Sphingomonas panacisoli]|uniref:Glycosyltransferase family 2 protein n=1 Tax=Sphingomonas panacisoli TaxID=1813879 RepID=A0A5B8LJS6_9SPHN|nr:glycosyltransferase [Sphingomonas panacisoli]QDZ08371.1 glycosyltransferase family 2 protein [Sphingomonas panacisoli]